MSSDNTKIISKVVKQLAKKYAFDVKEAMTLVGGETPSKKVSDMSKTEKISHDIENWTKKMESEEDDAKKAALADKIEKAKVKLTKAETDSEGSESDSSKKDNSEKLSHKIDLWSKKLAEGKIADDKKAAHVEKIEKAKARLAKLEEAAKPKPVTTEKRITRMSPTITKQLTAALEKAGKTISKEVTNDFKKYVEELAQDDWLAQGLSDHMTAFAGLSVDAAPVAAAAPAEEKAVVVVEVKTPKKTTKAASTNAPKKAAKAGETVVLSLEDLQNIEVIATVGNGLYWDADNGRNVTGPSAVEDEDIEVVDFENVEYGVAEKSGIVYQEVDGKDQLQGYIGVGKFKEMTRA